MTSVEGSIEIPHKRILEVNAWLLATFSRRTPSLPHQSPASKRRNGTGAEKSAEIEETGKQWTYFSIQMSSWIPKDTPDR